MAKRKQRFVYDSGTIVRMTERQYLQFICAGIHRLVSASEYGTVIGEASFNATRATTDDYRNERAQLGLIALADQRDE